MPGLVLVTAPAVEPITLTDAKLYCKQDDDTDDDLIAQLLTAARTRAENLQGMAYLPQTWDLFLDGFPYCNDAVPSYNGTFPYSNGIFAYSNGAINLKRAPIQSVTYIKYTDYTGAQTTMSTSDYVVDTSSYPGRIVPAFNKTWPVVSLQPTNGVVVRFVAGFASESDVPENFRNAIRELLIHYYEHRSVTPEIPAGVQAELWESAVRPYA